MKPLIRSLCTVVIGFSLSCPLNARTARQYVDGGELLLKKDTRQAFKSFQKAVQLSKLNNEWYQYFRTINRLASLKDVLTDDDDITFSELKEAVGLLRNIKADSSIALEGIRHFKDDNLLDQRKFCSEKLQLMEDTFLFTTVKFGNVEMTSTKLSIVDDLLSFVDKKA